MVSVLYSSLLYRFLGVSLSLSLGLSLSLSFFHLYISLHLSLDLSAMFNISLVTCRHVLTMPLWTDNNNIMTEYRTLFSLNAAKNWFTLPNDRPQYCEKLNNFAILCRLTWSLFLEKLAKSFFPETTVFRFTLFPTRCTISFARLPLEFMPKEEVMLDSQFLFLFFYISFVLTKYSSNSFLNQSR